MLEGLFQPTHLLVILAVALFVFGPKKLPELGKGLGDGIRNFRDSMKQATEAAKTDTTSSTSSNPNNTTDHPA
jgi:sec-independent protein translocase protein TatA